MRSFVVKIISIFLVASLAAEPVSCKQPKFADTQTKPFITPLHIGEYKIVKMLGKGDQARVYKAFDVKQRVVALKVFYTPSEFASLHPEKQKYIEHLFESDGSSKAANAEYSVGKLFDHPRIMKIFSKKRTYTPSGEKVTFLEIEYVEGKNLGQVQKESLSKKKALTLAKQLVSSLQYSFSKGLIHDDLWSENVFLDSQKNLKLIDLGSFDELPSEAMGQKPKGRYQQYHKVIKAMLKTIIELGQFTERERARILAAIDQLAKASDDCPISRESKQQIVENLGKLKAELKKIRRKL